MKTENLHVHGLKKEAEETLKGIEGKDFDAIKKNAQDYMKLPYTKNIQEINDESGHYFYGTVLELDGCQSTGDTLEELYESLSEAMLGYIETKLENNLPIPTPESVK